MEIDKLIDGIEKFIYTILTTIILYLKTCFKLLFTTTMQERLFDELDKPEKEQFKAFLSPIRFFVTTVLLMFLFAHLVGNGQENKPTDLNKVLKDNAGFLYGLIITISLLALCAATLMVLLAKQELTTETLKKPLHGSFFSITYILLGYLLLFVVALIFGFDGMQKKPLSIIVFCVLVYCFWRSFNSMTRLMKLLDLSKRKRRWFWLLNVPANVILVIIVVFIAAD